MTSLIIGAGQIGSELEKQLTAHGEEVVVLRRSPAAVGSATVVSGDARDSACVERTMHGARAVFHCMHTDYSATAWRQVLPRAEKTVMDAAAAAGVPVVFPESVYAFGRGARSLSEDLPMRPASPLGEVRKELLEARAAHSAHTASVVASDLVGPTAASAASVLTLMVLDPIAAGKRRVWTMGDPDAPHSATYLPDLARAMIAAVDWAAPGGRALNAPAGPAMSQRQMAATAARAMGGAEPAVLGIPSLVFAAGGVVSRMLRELWNQRYLWSASSVLQPGALMSEQGLTATPWSAVLDEWAQRTQALTTAAAG